jgi:hypothetical protein
VPADVISSSSGGGNGNGGGAIASDGWRRVEGRFSCVMCTVTSCKSDK